MSDRRAAYTDVGNAKSIPFMPLASAIALVTPGKMVSSCSADTLFFAIASRNFSMSMNRVWLAVPRAFSSNHSWYERGLRPFNFDSDAFLSMSLKNWRVAFALRARRASPMKFAPGRNAPMIAIPCPTSINVSTNCFASSARPFSDFHFSSYSGSVANIAISCT